MSDTIEVFISYSKQDKELRDGLLAHLRPLERQGIITWHDRQILPGTEWDEEIKARLNAADIILLLLSSDFLATDYCTQVEIPEALRRHEAEEATVIPVILRHCGWQFTDLKKIQAYPEKAKPIKSWSDIDEAYTDVVNGVYLAATQIKERRKQQQQAAEQEKLRQTEQLKQQQAAAAERLRQEARQEARQEELERQRQAQREQEAEKQRQQELEQNRSLHADDFSSDYHIDYTRLRDLLKAEKWREADQETNDKMCEAMGRQEAGWLRIEDIEQFPCADLRTIDRLWVKYSDGKFGFSVQKKIWQEYGSPTDENWERFCNRVGWRAKGSWISYSNVKFNASAVQGHLPCRWIVGRGFLNRFGEFGKFCGGIVLFLLSRAETCEL